MRQPVRTNQRGSTRQCRRISSYFQGGSVEKVAIFKVKISIFKVKVSIFKVARCYFQGTLNDSLDSRTGHAPHPGKAITQLLRWTFASPSRDWESKSQEESLSLVTPHDISHRQAACLVGPRDQIPLSQSIVPSNAAFQFNPIYVRVVLQSTNTKYKCNVYYVTGL